MRKIKSLIPQNIKNIYHFGIAFFAVVKYGYPAKKLTVIGVTGTDGKTTTCTIIYHLLKAAGKKVALISTVAAYIGEEEIDIGFHVTSPDPIDLQRLIKTIADKGYDYLVLETTSHGFDQHRLLGTNIKIGVLTNITHEHLDYHKTYDNYIKAKSKLFKKVEIAILNKDDKSFSNVRKFISKDVKILEYSTNTLTGQIKRAVQKRFVASYNQSNATAAILVARHLGVDDNTLVKSISTFPGVIGRMQEIKNNKDIKIIVDFAHTPNGLESVLSALAKQKSKGTKLIAIFGCASQRDDAKRPIMGEISTRLADISMFTAEDPRYEDINKIINEMAAGVKKNVAREVGVSDLAKLSKTNKRKHSFIRIPERGEAIYIVLNKIAKKGDTIVICGKGHEKSMSYFGVEYPWSDQKAVNLALNGMKYLIKHP